MLRNFKLVNTEGLTGLYYKGRLVPFEKIDDQLAEELVGKTHVLERLAAAPTAAVAVAAGELAAPEGETAPTGRKARS